ncbi:MAG TPA: hypothetical protein G4O15_08720 [Dehalococcoidia bacterium]|nr:hypothetical protein [Dehalococcoidia bacterium]
MDKSIGNFKVIIKVLISISLLTLAFVFGIFFNRYDVLLQQNRTNINFNKDLNAKIEAKLIETHSTQYIEKPVTEIKYVERIEKEHVNLRNFVNLEELINWLDAQKSSTTYDLSTPHTNLDCDDYADELQRKALDDGYIMSFQVIDAEKYNDLFEMFSISPDTLHAINLVLIDNSVYYIEPQTGEIQFAAHLD